MAEKPLTIEWKNLMLLVERLGFGEIKIIVQQGKPVRVDYALKQVKLDRPIVEKTDDEVVDLGE